jgi:carbamoyltransferase
VVLQERVDQYFDMAPGTESPYMLLVAPVREDHRLASTNGDPRGLDKLKVRRSDIPAVTHVDCSARVQTVDRERHGRFYDLIRAFERKTGCPVVINTSFNVRGEPIVCTPEQAYRCFMATNMDVLVLERAVLLKVDQPESRALGPDEFLAQFEAD